MTRPLTILLLYVLTTIILAVTLSPFLLFMMAVPFIVIFIDAIIHGSTDTNYITGIFYLRRIKRVYTQYGRFYLIIKKDDISLLFQDKIFYLKSIDYARYHDIEQTKEWIKKATDHLYIEKSKKDSIMSQLKGWNGYVDKQTERDKKLEKIL